MFYRKDSRFINVDEELPPVMSRDDAARLLAGVIEMNRREVRDSLIKGHLRVAVAISATYVKNTGLYPAELYSEALYALTIAAERAVSGYIKHSNFKDYARHYIHGYVSKYVKNNRSIVTSPDRVAPPKSVCYDDEKHDIEDTHADVHIKDKIDHAFATAGLDDLEIRIMELHLVGWSNNMIAAELGVSHTHIDNKRRIASEKLRKAFKMYDD